MVGRAVDMSRGAPDSAPLSVLVVEDDRELRETLCSYLERRGCVVAPATTAPEGLEAIVLGQFDVVVSDVQMLPRGGLWLWQEAMTLRPELQGHFVFCSNDPASDGLVGAILRERFVLKPFELLEAWRAVLAIAGRREPDDSQPELAL